ncbi:MAG: ATP:cob(I)alamin adenosyltransferase [Candidatus Magasanikbacteria bacterium RIFOXYD2_FULL_39_9]|uniref:Corrinoid adenosyltransferase n=1 Tax=Candidatus Magasanikbacteria bacterium RIFOXYD1_FULL_40_23 TaxID=1798705 RepID=A0A1F6PA47_9BACT|nr:MAG: ATP:cob(I)alamin adenosyltransferase [Candidatus Magasanikbacteria bacterium RIFOXYD2_FULL_39_9]OGH93042.1 MAG: ATP:cob(I)alamin adenosyltransferase [Candidatus Magasanikbacteria bacterium RIFOXYD1_FULL_40_23]
MKIYTKTGDKGETSLLGGKRVSKSCLEMQVIGEVDELNAALGVVVALLYKIKNEEIEKIGNFIQNIQRDLFKFGAELAAMQGPLEDKIEKIDSARVGEMEVFIDKFWNELPPLKNFILPGGSLAGAELHRARTVCRRVERQLVDFAKNVPIRAELNVYLNRLSDFLFAAARWVNFTDEEEEIKV